jgi:hypothetical protein
VGCRLLGDGLRWSCFVDLDVGMMLQ